VIRKIQEEQNQVTAGQNIISIKTSADYVIRPAAERAGLLRARGQQAGDLHLLPEHQHATSGSAFASL
jgi:hypothetical protein